MIRDRPALELAADGLGQYVEPSSGDRRVMCRFLNSTWWQVRLVAWDKDEAGRWVCLICWHVRGQPYGAWFVYDEAQFWR